MALVSDSWPFPQPGRSGALALDSFQHMHSSPITTPTTAATLLPAGVNSSLNLAAATASVDLSAAPSPAVVARYARPGHSLRPSTAPLSRVRSSPLAGVPLVAPPTPPPDGTHVIPSLWPSPSSLHHSHSSTTPASAPSTTTIPPTTTLIRRHVPVTVARSASVNNNSRTLSLKPVVPSPVITSVPQTRILLPSSSVTAVTNAAISWPVVAAHHSTNATVPASSSLSTTQSTGTPSSGALLAAEDEIYALRREVTRLRYDLSRHGPSPHATSSAAHTNGHANVGANNNNTMNHNTSLSIATAVSERDRTLVSYKQMISRLENELHDAISSSQRADRERQQMSHEMDKMRAALTQVTMENTKLTETNERLRAQTQNAQHRVHDHVTDTALLQRELARLKAEHEPCSLLNASMQRLMEQIKSCQDTIRGLQQRLTIADAATAEEHTKFNASQANVIRLTEQLAEQTAAYKRASLELESIARVDRELKATRSGYSIALEAMRKLQDAHASLQAAHEPCHLNLHEARHANAPLHAEVARLRAIVDGTSKENIRRSQLVTRARTLLSMMAPHLGISFVTSHDGHGVVVTAVQSRSPADLCGIRKRDRVLSVNAKTTMTKQQLIIAMEGFTPGTSVALQVIYERMYCIVT
jgi:predicted  nucleic acid-binding Zn-ribbon protein